MKCKETGVESRVWSDTLQDLHDYISSYLFSHALFPNFFQAEFIEFHVNFEYIHTFENNVK